MTPRTTLHRVVAAAMAVTAAALIAACSTGTSSRTATSTPGPSTVSTTPAISGMPNMPGMTEPMPSGDGLSASQSGFTLVPGTTTIAANTAGTFTFRITKPDGATVTHFVPEQSQLLHF